MYGRQRREYPPPHMTMSGDVDSVNSASSRLYGVHHGHAPGYSANPHHRNHPPPENLRLTKDTQLEAKRRRAKSLLLLAGVAFLAVMFLDGVIQLTILNGPTRQPQTTSGRHLNNLTAERSPEVSEQQMSIQERSLNRETALNYQPLPSVIIDTSERRALHRLPLLPKRALQNRQRRELYRARKPLPLHLREDYQDGMYDAPPSLRRRMYPRGILENDGADYVVVDSRTHRADERRAGARGRRTTRDAEDETALYETGALYQGYGTHYLDLWVGTPPQRQTVILDTGSSVTAFPCTGCERCGSDAVGHQYHLDPDYDKSASRTYRESSCDASESGETCGIGSCTSENDGTPYCKLAVAYAEGSTWTAAEGSDVVYPSGLHEEALAEGDEREENGVGVGMGKIGGKEFDWMDFRLGFGCQTKVTGLFQTQLEDGIMGMDNRKGSFWLQLHDHYKNAGYVHDENDPFDPSQFSLCYDRQPMSGLSQGVGSGSLTLGGSDPLLHGTPMVFAENVTPQEGWYTVHIKGMFLRTKGGSLGEPYPNANEISYIRVDSDENTLNGDTQQELGPIVDSGTTDTYLSASLSEPFNEAWKKALQNPGAQFSNDPVRMTPEQIKALPTVMVVLRGHVSNSQQQSDGNTAIGMVGHPNHAPLLRSDPQDTTLNALSPHDVVVAIPPEHYMEESLTKPGLVTARIYFTERYGDRSILGSNFIMGHEVLFDNTAGRIGFAESHCDYERYMAEKATLLQTLIDETSGSNADGSQGVASDGQGAADAAAPLTVQGNEGQPQAAVAPVDGPGAVDATALVAVQGNEAQPQAAVSPVDGQGTVDATALVAVQGNEGQPHAAVAPAGGQGVADAPAPVTVQGNGTPVEGDAPASSSGENQLSASGWSRRTQDVTGLRQAIRIPG